MKKLIPLLLTALLFAACGDDDSNSQNNGSANSLNNANAFTAADFNGSMFNSNMPEKAASYARRIEMPHLKRGNRLVIHDTNSYGVNFIIEWDDNKKAQRWTAYTMHRTTGCYPGSAGRNEDFKEDTSIPSMFRSTLADYRGSGFDRGHLCPSADRQRTVAVNQETFVLSNMHPQCHNFNAGIWEKMEDKLRKWVKASNAATDTFYVVKGGTIEDGQVEDQTIGSNHLPIPHYFFMAILMKNNTAGNGGYKAIAFWSEHHYEDRSADALTSYVISVRQLEQKTGIDFFCNLPDDIENAVEINVYPDSWDWK